MKKWLILIFIPGMIFSNTERDMEPQPELSPKKIHEWILFYTNVERIEKKLSPLVYDEILEKAAVWQAEYCAGIKGLSHTADVSGMKTPGDRIRHFNGSWMTYGENLTVSFAMNMAKVSYTIRSDAKGKYKDFGNKEISWYNENTLAYAMVSESWMNSPGHRANILSPKFYALGAGSAKGEYSKQKEAYYGCQVFTGNKKWDFSLLTAKKKKNQIRVDFPEKGLEVVILSFKKLPGNFEVIKALKKEGTESVFEIEGEGIFFIACFDPETGIYYPVKKIKN